MTTRKLDFFIIDDSEVNNYYTEDLLREYEFTNSVEVFLNAKNALKALISRLGDESKLPDVIFLDVRMPEMDGFEFIDELEQQVNDREFPSKVFVLTSSKHRRDIESFEKQFIACEFMNKPEGSEIARTEVTKALVNYIKENNLIELGEDSKNKIVPDEKLKSLLGIQDEELNDLTYFNIQKYMNKHFYSKKEAILST